MAEMFPTKQTFVDEKLANGEQIVITRVKILSSTSDHVKLPRAVDAQLLQADRTTADPTFYLGSNKVDFSIDGATVGTEYVIASRHQGMLNYDRGKNVPGGGL